ncbi:MAG: hypothetical protein EOO03_10600, partial [Chitinophagaceae bacterium]
MIRKWLLTTFLLLCLSVLAVCQPHGNADEERVLALYEKQLSNGLMSRGMSASEIEKYMARGKSGMNSVNDFSRELLQLYPPAAAKKLAVLFYFFSNDTLHRYFITPGHIKEKAQIAVTKYQLEQLNSDVLNALKVYDLSKNRSPKNRGNIPLAAPKKTGVKFDNAIKNATEILLPKSFDERYEQLVVIPAFSIGAFPFQLLR